MSFKIIEEQRRIVRSLSRRILVNSGPGTGKTTALALSAVKHALRLINGLLRWADRDARVLLVSLTNNAADEADEAVSELVNDRKIRRFMDGIPDPPAVRERILCCTLHSFALRMLRKYIGSTRYRTTILIDNDSNQEILEELIKDYRSKLKGIPNPLKLLNAIHQRRVRTRQSYSDIINQRYPHDREREKTLIKILSALEAKKLDLNRATHDDTLWEFFRLLRTNQGVRDEIRRAYPVILVDEFQDTGTVQWQIIKQLVGPRSSLLVAGDDGQTVFLWADASLERFRHFRRAYPNCRTFPLTVNLRSSKEIVALSNALIAQAQFVSKKQVRALFHGPKPQVVISQERRRLYKYITDQIRRTVAEGHSFNDIAILYRHHHDALTLQNELVRHRIPFQVRGDKSRRDRPFVNLIAALVRIIENCAAEDDRRKMLLSLEGVGQRSVEQILSWLETKPPAVTRYPRQLRFAQSLDSLLQFIADVRRSKVSTRGKILRIIDFIQSHLPKVNNTLMARDKATLLLLGHQCGCLTDVIEKYFDGSYPLLYPGEGPLPYPDSYVTLSTIHQAKGSGKDSVFFLGTDDTLFVKHRSFASPKKREQELLVMNVAVTRAKRELHLLFPVDGKAWKKDGDVPNPWIFIRKCAPALYKLVRL